MDNMLSKRYIYRILIIKRFDEAYHEEGQTEEKARRIANIYAVTHTVEAWQRGQSGNMRNLYNPEGWRG